jgi:hypothetical protein
MELFDGFFGATVKYPFPAGCNAVIVCVDLMQHTPVYLCLPHQVYLHDLEKLLEKHPGARGITLIPCRTDDKVMIASTDIRSAAHDRRKRQAVPDLPEATGPAADSVLLPGASEGGDEAEEGIL